MAGKTIPIFPLDLVLFPRQELPLRVFEPRYKQMVDDCMLGDGQFGVCLTDGDASVMGWDAPHQVGTLAKIIRCEDVGIDGMQLGIETLGRNPFRIGRIIPPVLARPPDYDPSSVEGHERMAGLHEDAGAHGKMYIRAEVEMIPEIDESVPLERWQGMINLWKRKVIAQAQPRVVEPHALDHMLEQYYLATETPTTDYVYSLAALGAGGPGDLQPLLEASSMDMLLERLEALLAVE